MKISWNRRSFLAGAGSLLAAPMLGGMICAVTAQATQAAEDGVPLRLTNTNTGESYDVQLFVDGGWNPNALLVCDHLMRDWRQAESVACDRKLYASLYVMQRFFAPNERIRINSGFRTRKTNDLLRAKGYNPADNSQHLYARAVDFSIPGAKLRDVATAVRELKIGGTGLYLNDGFVHMDTRGSLAQWGDRF